MAVLDLSRDPSTGRRPTDAAQMRDLASAIAYDRRARRDQERAAVGSAFPRLRRLTVSFFTRDGEGGACGRRALRSQPGSWECDDGVVVRPPGAPPAPAPAPLVSRPRGRGGAGASAGLRRGRSAGLPVAPGLAAAGPGTSAALAAAAVLSAPAWPAPLPPNWYATTQAAREHFRLVAGLVAVPGGGESAEYPREWHPAAVPRLRRSHRRATAYYELLDAVGVRRAGRGTGGVGHGDHRRHAVRYKRRRRAGAAAARADSGVDDPEADDDDAVSGSEYEGPELFADVVPRPPHAAAAARTRAGGGRQRFPLVVRGSAALMRAVVARVARDIGALEQMSVGDPRGPDEDLPCFDEFYLRGLAYGLPGNRPGDQAVRDYNAARQRFRPVPIWTRDLAGIFDTPAANWDSVQFAWQHFRRAIRKLAVMVWGYPPGNCTEPSMMFSQAALWQYLASFHNIETLELCIPPLGMYMSTTTYLPATQALGFEINWNAWRYLRNLHIESTYFSRFPIAWFTQMRPTLRRLTLKRCGMPQMTFSWNDFLSNAIFQELDLEVFTIDRCWIGGVAINGAINARSKYLIFASPPTPRSLDDPAFLDLSGLRARVAASPTPMAFLVTLLQRMHIGRMCDADILEFKEEGDQA
jgi:hypothetical protein